MSISWPASPGVISSMRALMTGPAGSPRTARQNAVPPALPRNHELVPRTRGGGDVSRRPGRQSGARAASSAHRQRTPGCRRRSASSGRWLRPAAATHHHSFLTPRRSRQHYRRSTALRLTRTSASVQVRGCGLWGFRRRRRGGPVPEVWQGAGPPSAVLAVFAHFAALIFSPQPLGQVTVWPSSSCRSVCDVGFRRVGHLRRDGLPQTVTKLFL